MVDERGRLYTVGGTSGINYFMDVFSLDLTRFVEKSCYKKKCCGSGIRCLFDPRIRDPGWVKKIKIRDPDPG